MKWNCNNIIDFLKIYEQYPLLWNIKHKDYLNTKLKDEMFKKLYDQSLLACTLAIFPARAITLSDFTRQRVK